MGGKTSKLEAFDYIIPDSIANNPDALEDYNEAMNDIAATIRRIEGFGIPREDSAMLLPLGMTTNYGSGREEMIDEWLNLRKQ